MAPKPDGDYARSRGFPRPRVRRQQKLLLVASLWLLQVAMAATLQSAETYALPEGEPTQSLPMRCGLEMPAAYALPSPSSELPAGTRSWECIPGVIRSDGVESFRVEVDVNGPVNGVTMDQITELLVPPSPAPVTLRDDGLGGDRVAGDSIFTSGPFTYKTAIPLPPFYQNDASSPAGLYTTRVGFVRIQETDATVTQFLLAPEVGLLRSDIPAVGTSTLSPDVMTSGHCINLRSSARHTQRTLRFLGGNLAALTGIIYQLLPDSFDILVFFSHDKIERLPRNDSSNFVAGLHQQVQTNFTGTGQSLFDASGSYGSAGSLLGINLLDAYGRGVLSNNVTHEIVHQWSAWIDFTFGLTDGSPHYSAFSSVGSLVGGFLWSDDGSGTFMRHCDEGRNGAHHAPPLDLYLMGLVTSDDVAPLHVSSGGPPLDCNEVISSYSTVTMVDIQNRHSPRTPGPASALRDFRLGFVVESHDRLLDPTEMTFYEILAGHYTGIVPPADPDPYLGFNWAPVTRFFGPGVSWRSDVPTPTDALRMPPASTSFIYPNPFRAETTIRFEFNPQGSSTGPVQVEIYDVSGRLVRTILDTLLAPGPHGAVVWDARDDGRRFVPAGAYFYRLTAGRSVTTGRLLRLR